MTLVGKEAMVEPYDGLFGGNTYDVFAAHATDNHPMHNFTAITGDIAAEVAGLKEQDGLLLQVYGSCELIQTLLSHNLVEELRLWIFRSF